MGRKSRKRKKHNRISVGHHFMKPFILTFSVVMLIGVGGIAAYQWIIEPVKSINTSHFQVNVDSIKTAGESETELAAEVEEQTKAQIEEIISVNDKYDDVLNDPAYMVENNIYAKNAAEPDRVTITFAGDILFDDNYAIMTRVVGNDDISNGISPELIEEMKSADIMMLNNEFPYSDGGSPLEEKQFTFRAKPYRVSYLNDLGVDIVSLANNHAYDYGESAFLDTMATLESAGIAYVGAGRNLQEARRPVYYIINNMKIAIVSATQIERLDHPDTKGATDSSAGVFRCWNGDNLLETVREAKENSDFVIVYLHWGTENVSEIDWAQEKQGAEVAAAGADLIIGAHPHCLQPISIVQGVPVVYSLGNFWFNSRTIDTGMIKVEIDESGLKSCRFLPCLQQGSRTVLLQGEEKLRVLNDMRNMSPGVQIDDEGYITW
ncbi:MAG: CapA family protein [Lachnospiraceae bacterium]|nr:CapA family protein [Lachnospiraceae bacterium]